jgi:hypothetical protein
MEAISRRNLRTLLSVLPLISLPLCASVLNAQDAVEAALPDPVADGPAQTYEPLTLRQNYVWSLGEIFGPARLVAVALHAGLDQIGNHDDGWGSHPSGFGIRAASWFGQGFVRENVAFGILTIAGFA